MKTFYVIELTKPGAKVSRYALYRIIMDKSTPVLDVVWPYHEEDKDNLWPCQVYHKRNGFDYPAYHFKVGNIGYSKMQYLSEAISERLKDKIELLKVRGWAPSRS